MPPLQIGVLPVTVGVVGFVGSLNVIEPNKFDGQLFKVTLRLSYSPAPKLLIVITPAVGVTLKVIFLLLEILQLIAQML